LLWSSWNLVTAMTSSTMLSRAKVFLWLSFAFCPVSFVRLQQQQSSEYKGR
jgi:hypothetical protein